MAKENNNNWINKHLRFALADVCNKSEANITKAYLSTLKEIDLSGKGITDLKGIQHATNLININLSKNRITDASLLKHLKKLITLDLCENRVEDVSFLSSLTKLKSIGLDSNNISSIPDLNELKNLSLLNISNNKIKDVSFIQSINLKNTKIIASEQWILLNAISVDYGSDYTFKPFVRWDEENEIYYDNVQITGKYHSLETDERPSLLYSISKMLIKNICSDCIIKADFYHEVPFLKSGILSGTLIQPIIVKLTNLTFDLTKLKKYKSPGKIYGKLNVKTDTITERKAHSYNLLKNKIITIIDSKGNKSSCLTNNDGEYEFKNLDEGRYTILFPFINDCEYVTPSLYIFNLKEGEFIEVDSTLLLN